MSTGFSRKTASKHPCFYFQYHTYAVGKMSDKRNEHFWTWIIFGLNSIYYILNLVPTYLVKPTWFGINAISRTSRRTWCAITFNKSAEIDESKEAKTDLNKESEKDKFKVFIYEDELRNIHDWVLKKDNIETGGDLFGLWIDQHTAVVQLVLGPGKNCERTETSFFQDLNYLSQCGEAITKGHGLCNIGQWHSHHRLSLNEPSLGDEDTVWGNMPGLGLNRFIVFIATIEKASTVNVNPFLFEIDSETERRLPVQPGAVEYAKLSRTSPLRSNGNLLRKLEQGDEREDKSMNCSTIIDILTEEN